MAQRQLDLFKVLTEISKKNVSYYNTLSDQQKKEFIPFLFQRWLSGTTNKQQIILLNEISNKFVFTFGYSDPELLYKLFTICTSGKFQKYSWIKQPSKTKHSKPTSVKVLCDYYRYSEKEARNAINCLSQEDILYYAEQLGRQPEEISKIKKEFSN